MTCKIIVTRIEIKDDIRNCDRDFCPFEAVRFNDGQIVVDIEQCTGCLACMALCGPDSIKVYTEWICER